MWFYADGGEEIKEWLPRLLLGGLMGLAIVKDWEAELNKRIRGKRVREDKSKSPTRRWSKLQGENVHVVVGISVNLRDSHVRVLFSFLD